MRPLSCLVDLIFPALAEDEVANLPVPPLHPAMLLASVTRQVT